jgi:hypothetical protein
LPISRHTGRKAGIKRLLQAEIVLHVHTERFAVVCVQEERRRVKDIDKKRERKETI